MSPIHLEARGLRIVRNGRELVRDIDLIAHPGTITVLIGASGCGKTTILKALALLEPIQGGEILLNQRAVQDLSEPALQRERLRGPTLAYVFQSHALFDDLSVRANLCWALDPYRADHLRPSAVVQEKARLAAERAGVPLALLDRAVTALSGGERKRVAIARALMLSPQLILYDEPTAGLDPPRARSIDRLIRELRDQGLTSIVATHDLDSVVGLADQIIYIHKDSPEHAGRIAFCGDLKGLLEDPRGRKFFADSGLRLPTEIAP